MSAAFAQALHAPLACSDPAEKLRLVAALDPAGVPDDRAPDTQQLSLIPGRPQRPKLVDPRAVKRRGLGSAEGRAVLVHAIAHIEFNAINLALDAAYRFRGLPPDYYADWISVAKDEARHFQMLSARLQVMGYDYGDFPAHDGLWEAAEKTAHDLLIRMALVPRVLEARGLDVTPGMIDKLEQAGDQATVAVLRVILREEVRHVEIGTRWFRQLCEQRGLEPDATFRVLLSEHRVQVRPPLNWPARLSAGFRPEELPDYEVASSS